jgi:hypothetical protein
MPFWDSEITGFDVRVFAATKQRPSGAKPFFVKLMQVRAADDRVDGERQAGRRHHRGESAPLRPVEAVVGVSGPEGGGGCRAVGTGAAGSGAGAVIWAARPRRPEAEGPPRNLQGASQGVDGYLAGRKEDMLTWEP